MGRTKGDVLADHKREVLSEVRAMIRVCTLRAYKFQPRGVPYCLPGSLYRQPSLLCKQRGDVEAWGSEPRQERGEKGGKPLFHQSERGKTSGRWW